MQHYSPSSDDSPVDHRHNIRLSDFRHVSPRGHSAPPAPLDFSNPVGGPAFARAENKRGLDALSVIHGSQSGLRTSIQQERHKIGSVTEEVQSNNSALFQSPRRRPPKAPNAINAHSEAGVQYEPVDYSSVHSTATTGNARSRLSSLIHRERILRQEIERNANPAVTANRLPRRPAPSTPEHAAPAPVNRGGRGLQSDRDVQSARGRATGRAEEEDKKSNIGDAYSRNEQSRRYRNESASADGFRRRNLELIRNWDVDRDQEARYYYENSSSKNRRESSVPHDGSSCSSDGVDEAERGAVPVSSLSVKTLLDSHREAMLRLRLIAVDLSKADTFEEIALLVGRHGASKAMQTVGIEQCSVWFMNLNQSVASSVAIEQGALWTCDSYGIVSTENSSTVPSVFVDCLRRQKLDSSTIGMRHHVIYKDPSGLNVEEFDNFVATLGGLKFESDDVRLPSKKDRKYSVEGVELWTSIYTTDWSAGVETSMSNESRAVSAGCISASFKADPAYAFLDGSETLFVEQLLSQLSSLVSARVAVIDRKRLEEEYDYKLKAEASRLSHLRRHIEYSQLFEEASNDIGVSKLLARAGTDVFQHALMSYCLVQKHLVPQGTDISERGFHVMTSAVSGGREGSIVLKADSQSALLDTMLRAIPGEPITFASNLSGIAESGLLQYSDIDAFSGCPDLAVLVAAIDIPGADLSYGRCYLVVVFESSVLRPRDTYQEFSNMAKHLSRWARGAFERIQRGEDIVQRKSLVSVLPDALLNRSGDEQKAVIDKLLLNSVSLSKQVEDEDEDISLMESDNTVAACRFGHLAASVHAVSTPNIAESLGAERCRLLLAGTFLNLQNTASDLANFTLYGSNTAARSSRFVSASPSIAAPQFVQICDVACENTSEGGKNNNAMWSPRGTPAWVTRLRQRRCVHLESVYSATSRSGFFNGSDWSELRDVVRSIDSNATTALLLPIFAPGNSGEFVGVLMLSNKRTDSVVNSGKRLISETSSCFDESDVVRLEESSISVSVGSMLQSAALQDLSTHVSFTYAAQMSDMIKSLAAYQQQIDQLRQKNNLLKKFNNWKYASRINAERNRKEEESSVMSRFLKSVTTMCHNMTDVRSRPERAICSLLESYLVELFTDDRVSVEIVEEKNFSTVLNSPRHLSNSWILSPSKGGKAEVGRAEITGMIYGKIVSGDFQVQSESVSNIMSQISTPPLKDKPTSVNLSEDELRHWDWTLTDVRFKVKISRQLLVGRSAVSRESPFSDMEEMLLENFCQLAGQSLSMVNVATPSTSLARIATSVIDSVLRCLHERRQLPLPNHESSCAPEAVNPRSSHAFPYDFLTASVTATPLFSCDNYLSSGDHSSSSSVLSSSSSSTLSSAGSRSVPETVSAVSSAELPPLSPGARPAIPQSVMMADSCVSLPPPKYIKEELCDDLLDFLTHFLPVIFGQFLPNASENRAVGTTEGVSSRDIFSSLSFWLKKISKCDIALLRIISPQLARQWEQGDGTYVSSEDVGSSDVFSRIPHSLAADRFRQYVIDQSQPQSERDLSRESSTSCGNMIYELLNGMSGGGTMGEVKIINAHRRHNDSRLVSSEEGADSVNSDLEELSDRRKLGVSIVCYLLSLSLAIPSKLAELNSVIAADKNQIDVMKENITGASRLLVAEKSLADGMRGKLSAVLSLVVLIEKINRMPTLEDLSMLVSEGLPTVLGVESAALLLPPSTVAKCSFSVAGEDTILNESWKAAVAARQASSDELIAVPSSSAEASGGGGLHVTWRQLNQVSLFSAAANGNVVQTHIPLNTPSFQNKRLSVEQKYGALLLFSPHKNETGQKSATTWSGLDEFLVSSLSSAIFSALSTFKTQSSMQLLESEMRGIEELKSRFVQQEELVSELKKFQEDSVISLGEKDHQLDIIARRLEETSSGFLSEISKLTEENNQRESLHAEQQRSSLNCIAELQSSVRDLSQTLSAYEEIHGNLKSMVKSFVDICGSNGTGKSTTNNCLKTAITWLQDIAHAQGYVLGTVQRNYHAELQFSLMNMPSSSLKIVREDSPDYLSIRSTVLSAAAEALRCQDVVECFIDNSASRRAAPGSTTQSNGGISVGIKSAISNLSTRYSATCVPNMSLKSSDTASSCACFVFVKVGEANSNADEEVVSLSVSEANREALLWATGLTSQMVTSEEMIGTDMLTLNTENNMLRSTKLRKDRFIDMLSQTITISSELWSRNIGNSSDIAEAVESYAAHLLSQSDYRTKNDSAGATDNNLVDVKVFLSTKKKISDSAVRKVLQTNTPQRVGLTLLLPICGLSGAKRGVMKIERKHMPPPVGSKFDEDDSINSGDGHEKESGRVASLVITEDEEAALRALCLLSSPSFDRISLINSTYEGVEQASMAIEALQGMQEDLRAKLAAEITSKYLLQDALKASTTTMNAVITRGVSTGQVHEALQRNVATVLGAQECCVISEHRSVFIEDDSLHRHVSFDESPGRYYMLDEDRAEATTEVDLQKGDVELITLQTGRPIVFTIGRSGESGTASHGDGTHEEWGSKSWAVRRYIDRAYTFTQLKESMGGKGSPEGVVGLSSSRGIPRVEGPANGSSGPLHVMAIPYNVLGVTAVIVVVRRCTDFSNADKDCLAHLLKVSTLCMTLGAATTAVKTAHHQYADLDQQIRHEKSINDGSISEQCLSAVNSVYAGNEGFDDGVVVQKATTAVMTSVLHGDNRVSFAANSDNLEALSKMIFGRESIVHILAINESDFQSLSTSKSPTIGAGATKSDSNAGSHPEMLTGSLRLHSITSYYWVDIINGMVVIIVRPRDMTDDCFMLTVNLSEGIESTQKKGQDRVEISGALLKIQSIIMLRIISFHGNWMKNMQNTLRNILDDSAEKYSKLEHECAELSDICAKGEADKDSFAKEWKEQHDHDILVVKDRYKSIIFDRSRTNKLTEMFFKTAISSCTHALVDSVVPASGSAKTSKKRNKPADNMGNSATALLKVLVKTCTEISVGMNTRICYCKSASVLASPPAPLSIAGAGALETGSDGAVAVTWVGSSGAIEGKKSRQHWRLGASNHSPDRSAIDRTHPIYLCMSMNCYVLISNRGDPQAEALDDLQRHQQNANSIPIVVCRSEEFSHGTLFVPILAPISTLYSQRVYFAIEVSPTSLTADIATTVDSKKSDTFGWHVSLKNLIFAWNMVREICVAVASQHEQIAVDRVAFRQAQIREGLSLCMMLSNNVKATSMRKAFSKWKVYNELDVKLSLMSHRHSSDLQESLSKITLLEQAVADWAEIVKSVNSVAVGSLAQGLRGVWAQACVPFMTLMASNVEVVSCGLLIANHMDDILELYVRDSPNEFMMRQDGNQSGISNLDGNSDSIEIRSGSELGAGVLAMTWNIISGNMEDRGGTNTRLWKLNKQNTLGVYNEPGNGDSDSTPEQMWLVPVRTAWAVLGVLRLTIKALPHRMDDHYLDPEGPFNIDFGDSHPIEQAKRNMINFAEVMAPIVLAARQVDVATSKQDEMSSEVERHSRRERAAITETYVSRVKARLLSRVTYDMCAVLDTCALRDIENLQEDILERQRSIRSGINHTEYSGLFDATEDQFGIEVLKKQMEQKLGEAFGKQVIISVSPNRSNAATATGNIDYHQAADYLKRLQEKNFRINTNTENDPPSVEEEKAIDAPITELIKNDIGEVLGTLTIMLPTESYIVAENHDVSEEHPSIAEQHEQQFYEAQALIAILPDVAALVHSVLIGSQRRVETNKAMVQLTNRVFAVEEDLTNTEARASDVAAREQRAMSSNEYHKALASILSHCLSVNSTITNYVDAQSGSPLDDMSSEMMDELFEDEELRKYLFQDRGHGKGRRVLAATGLLLSRFCDNAQAALRGRCSFRFGIITRDQSQTLLDSGSMITAEDVKIVWSHGHQGTAAFVPSDDNMGIGGSQVVNNLATACISAMQKSSVDVSFSIPNVEGSSIDIMKMNVLSIPLPTMSSVVNKTNIASGRRGFGVLQVFISPASEQMDQLVTVSNEVAVAMSATLANVTMLQEFASQLDKLSKISLDVQDTAEQAHVALDFWKSRAKQWKGVGLICNSIVKGISSGTPLVQTLLTEDATAYLNQAGISMKQVSLEGAENANPNSSSNRPQKDIANYASASMTVPLTNLTYENDDVEKRTDPNVVIELSCMSTAPPPDRGSGKSRAAADRHAEDMISMIGSLLQAVEFAMKSNNSAIRDTSSRCRAAELRAEALSKDIDLVKRHGQDIVDREESSKQELSRRAESDFRLNQFSLNFVNSVVIPSVREVVAQLGQLVEKYHNETSKLRPQLNDVDKRERDHSVQRQQVDIRAAVTLDRAYTAIAGSCDRAITNMVSHQLDPNGLGGSIRLNSRESSRLVWKKVLESGNADIAIPVYFHASVIVRRERTSHREASDEESAVAASRLNPKFASYDGSSGNHSLISEKDVSKAFSKEHQLQRQYASVLEKCFQVGGVQATEMALDDVALGTNFSYIDLLGIDVSTITILMSSTTTSGSLDVQSTSRLRVCCIPLGGSSNDSNASSGHNSETYRAPAVVRCVWVEAWCGGSGSHASSVPRPITTQLLPNLLELLCSNSSGILRWLSELAVVEDKLYATESDLLSSNAHNEQLEEELSRCRRLYRVVARESASLFDPPLAGSSSSVMTALQSVDHSDLKSGAKFTHPAYLAPVAATQDVCLKFLSIVRSLLRCEGQAVLLADIDTIPMSFQIISTGDALTWPGVPQGVFGKVFPNLSGVSLIESALKSHKAVVVSDIQKDSRYAPQLDGSCTSNTPGLIVPLRGRGGVVVGAVVVARGGGGPEFTIEDVTALDLAATMSSLSLYWCRGLGAVHLQLEKSLNRMMRLEQAVKTMKEK